MLCGAMINTLAEHSRAVLATRLTRFVRSLIMPIDAVDTVTKANVNFNVMTEDKNLIAKLHLRSEVTCNFPVQYSFQLFFNISLLIFLPRSTMYSKT